MAGTHSDGIDVDVDIDIALYRAAPSVQVQSIVCSGKEAGRMRERRESQAAGRAYACLWRWVWDTLEVMAGDRYTTLVIDLDGTLLDRHGQVSAANCAALREARAAGLEVLIASGRALVESSATLACVGHDGLMIAAGGALLCDAGSGRTLERRAMSPVVVHEATQTMIGCAYKVLLLKDRDAVGYDYAAVGPAALDPASEWWFEHLPVTVRFLDHVDDDEHPEATVRAAVVARDDELVALATQLRKQLDGRAMLQHWAAVTSSEATGSRTHLLEIFDRDVNKWTMVERYCKSHDIDPAKVVAIGDGLNDVEMVQHAGLGIAMANADARVLAVADACTTDHNEDGVAHAIDRILNGQAL